MRYEGSTCTVLTSQSSLLYFLTFTSLPGDSLPHSTFSVMAGKSQLERAIRAIQDRRPAPDIDFTQVKLNNGLTVSTQERLVKEVLPSFTLTHP